jgi:hypothetical protein
MRPDINEGAPFHDYELADHDGNARTLSELQGANPMVLHLSRGGYDPKEHRYLRRLVDAHPDSRRPIPESSSSPPTTSSKPTSSGRRSVRSGRSWPIPSGSCSGISTSRSTRIPCTIR